MKDRAPSELWSIMNHLLIHSAYHWVWCMVSIQPKRTTWIIVIIIIVVVVVVVM